LRIRHPVGSLVCGVVCAIPPPSNSLRSARRAPSAWHPGARASR
jgi:hypothetical protein